LTGIKYLENHSDVFSVCPSCKDENGQRQYLIKQYPAIFDLFLRGLSLNILNRMFLGRLSKYQMKNIGDSNENSTIRIMSGCFMLCRTDVLKQIGGFDERYFLYFEDFALSLEMGKLGKLVYLPSMKIIHYGGDAARKGLKHILMFIASGIKFFNHYGWKII